ncbi:MAG: biopolymer transporter ExbD, partial [Bdellovibrionales bacterium]|nr:biopolymer transporter ExbD [Bdellovibrionales bacterium]
MAFEETGSESGAISQINVTPLVDVMLVLLVIFMVTAPILQQGVEIELPRATIAPIEGEEEQVVVSIDQNGDVFLGAGNAVEVKDVGSRLQGILASRADKRVFIRADRRVAYGVVMQ